jgi:RNA polymerase sigma factor (sigma-70 family)
MAHAATGSVVRQLGALFEGGSMAGLSDRQLLERFRAGGLDPGGEAAFAALVARHGPMVLGVCRDLLGDLQHAEDAFQAVFLVLARKGPTLRDPDRLGNWLYGVAVRTSRCARQQIARRRRREEADTMRGPGPGLSVPTAPPADRPAIDREQAEALHEEVARLPRAFRLAVVLCYFEGLTLDEAARRLRCPAGTLRSRLARARGRLRIGLARRGVILPAAAMGAFLSPRSASASIPPLLCDSTTRAAIAFAARHAAAGGALSAPAAALAREVIRSMMFHKLRLVAMTAIALAGIATGAGFVTRSLAMKDEPARGPAAPAARVAPVVDDGQRPETPSAAALPRMTVTGRVLDPSGKPVPGAGVVIVLRWRLSDRPTLTSNVGQITGHDGRCDGSGRFRIELPRTSTSRHDDAVIAATAPGYGIGWTELDPDAESPDVDVTLRSELIVHGRLLDVNGQPAAGVPIVVLSATTLVRGAEPPQEVKRGAELPQGVNRPDFDEDPRRERSGWPASAISDAQGRFALRGLARGLEFSIRADDPRFERGIFMLQAGEGRRRFGATVPVIAVDTGPNPKPVTIALRPGRTISGRVTYADTGRPVPNAFMAVGGFRHGRADAEGCFRIGIEGMPRDGAPITVVAQSPDGAPYLMAVKRPVWPKAAVEQSVDLALRRGVVVRGRITEEGTGRPVAGAVVAFGPQQSISTPVGDTYLLNVPGMTGPDGTYRVAAPPGPGHLVVQGPSDDYVLREIVADGPAPAASRDRHRTYAHAYRALDLKADGPELEVDLALKPGVPVRGRVVGPDGQPIRDASIFSRAVLRAMPAGASRSWMAFGVVPRARVRDGRFVLFGLDPDAEVPAYFFEPEKKLGATVRLSGRSSVDGPVAVRLEPCGTARCRVVGPDGKPLVRYDARFLTTMIITPANGGPLYDDESPLHRIDPRAFETPIVSDAEGQLAIPSLIPGASYRIEDASVGGAVPASREEFTVKPGETLDLGDILIAKPPK